MLRIATRTITLFAILLVALGLPAIASDDGVLSFEERVRYQRLIEDVYWQNRIWPEENPGLKPALDEVMPDAVIRERVQSYLVKSVALEKFWSRPLTGEQLQAEMDRMVRHTKSPEMLAELFAALDDDPFLIAECLARPVLVDRLTRNWYARDTRFHGTLKEQAETALAVYSGDIASMSELGGRYEEMEFRLASEELPTTDPDAEETEHPTIDLNAEEWRDQIERIATLFGIEPDLDEIPLGTISRLTEDNDRFMIMSVLSAGQDQIKIATVTWNKQPFDAWWAEEGRIAIESNGGDNPVSSPYGGYKMRSRFNSGCSDDTWKATRDTLTARFGHSAVWTGTEMIVWGGEGATLLNSGGKYDPATDSWTPTSVGESVPSRRIGHTAVWTGTEMIVWGGEYSPSMSTYFQNSGGRYNPATRSWTPTSLGEGSPTERAGHTAVWTGSEMIVWGGRSEYGYRLNTGGRYDPETDSWTATSTGAGVPSARDSHTAVWTGTEMIVWGGSAGSYLNSGGRYNPATDSWTATSSGGNVPAKRHRHTAVWTGSEMIVWGGIGIDPYIYFFGTGGRYDPATDTWKTTSTTEYLPFGRQDHTAVWTGSEMIIWGGIERRLSYSLNTGWRYDPATDSWTEASTEGSVPSRRHLHTAVWTGSEMIVWGGFEYHDGVLNTGGRYNPVTDSWIPTYTGEDVPSERLDHTAVWTGAEMVVWGGLRGSGSPYPGGSHLNTGGRYDPSTDSWTTTSTVDGALPVRSSHTAVWTGMEMIVWGGLNGIPDHSNLNTGGRYDPVTNSWTTTSTADGVPSERSHHTAIWTGTEMIVWGGLNGSFTLGDAYMNTGGRYDPVTDSWTTTSTVDGVPSERSHHTAVWTGMEMIVWGGTGIDGFIEYYSTGGRYDPATDTWMTTSTVEGVPSKRSDHTAVWTGTEMIVWGGLSGSPYHNSSVNTGWRYDPVTDSWTTTSTVDGVPSVRNRHTAIWTGTEMIVWGGASPVNNSYYYRDSGGRYNPATNSWTVTATSEGAPSERAGHTVVWTGTEMIVWGGQDRNEELHSGGLYCACEGVRERERYEIHDDPENEPGSR